MRQVICIDNERKLPPCHWVPVPPHLSSKLASLAALRSVAGWGAALCAVVCSVGSVRAVLCWVIAVAAAGGIGFP